MCKIRLKSQHCLIEWSAYPGI